MAAAQLTFHWNARSLPAMPGDTIAVALWRQGIVELGSSRKRHRPLGASGAYLQGALVWVDGRPHVRADETLVEEGMDVRRQNVWPTARFDVLRLLRLVPASWLRGGFERPRWLPGGTRRFEWWERLLMFLAGEADLSPIAAPRASGLRGTRWDGDTVVVGGGPEGRRRANAAAASGLTVCLVSQSRVPGSFAAAMGAELPALDPRVKLLAGHVAVGVYREGRVVLAAPRDGIGPPAILVCRRLYLCTGRRSIPPLIPGHDLPGVLEARLALEWAPSLGAALGPAVVIGTGAQEDVARALRAHGVPIAAIGAVTELQGLIGRRRVRAARVGGVSTPCRCVIHAGPWQPDPSLGFQAAARGTSRLLAGALPTHVSLAGSASLGAETVPLRPLRSIGAAALCPCMDVTVSEVLAHIGAGTTHVEVLKRSTSCGMGPCQGLPCWEHLRAVVAAASGTGCDDRPTCRPPRRGLTVEQAAMLDGLLECE